MKIKWILPAALAAMSVIFSFAGTASARWYFSCNIDGYHHCDVNGMDIKMNSKCGPRAKSPPMGDGFLIMISEKTEVSPAGQAFLEFLEKEGMAVQKRTPVEGGPRKLSGRPVTIRLNKTDVGPVLAGFFTGVDPNWRGETSRGETSPAAASSATAATKTGTLQSVNVPMKKIVFQGDPKVFKLANNCLVMRDGVESAFGNFSLAVGERVTIKYQPVGQQMVYYITINPFMPVKDLNKK